MVEIDHPSFSTKDSDSMARTHEQPAYKDLIHLPVNYKELIVRKISELEFVLLDSELKLFESPNPHNGSEAAYLLEQFMGEDWVLASHLEPKRKTSKHKHINPMGTEQYYWLAGEAILNIEGEDLLLDSKHDFRAVPLDTFHQLRTEDSFVLTLIVMKNAKSVPAEKRHVPFE